MTTLKRAMLVLGVLAGMSQSATAIDVREPLELMAISDYRGISNALQDVRQLPEVRQIILVDTLQDRLADNRMLRLEGYVFQAGEPDLRVVAGRAEWFIDQVVLLPRRAVNSAQDLHERIEKWKAGIASRRSATPQHALKTKYAGKVQTGIVGGKAFEYIRNFDNFLDEWFPYGKSLRELEEILGIKLQIRNEEAVLVIDSGLAGVEYRFAHDHGTIRVVKRTLGN